MFILWLLLSDSSHSQEPTASFQAPQGGLYLSGDCSTLKKNLEALEAWKAQLEKNGEPPHLPFIEKVNQNTCRAWISPVLPSIFANIAGKKAAHDGPNCWGTALVLSKVLNSYRYASPEEMSFWLRSPLCRKLDDAEEKSPGDLVAIRELDPSSPGSKEPRESFSEVHGFLYLNEDIVISKNGSLAKEGFDIAFLDDVIDTYKTNGQNTWTDFFRCTSLEDFFEKEKSRLSLDYLAAHRSVRDAELKISYFSVERAGKYSWLTIANAKDRLLFLLQLVQSHLELHKAQSKELDGIEITNAEKFLWNALEQRLQSMLTQIEEFEDEWGS